MAWPTKVLMVNPRFFDVEYAINPHMLDQNGQLNKVDKDKAMEQWQNLKTLFEGFGLQVEVLDGQSGLPDMVFCANQTFPFIKEGKTHVVLSTMQSEKRQPEVAFFAEWAKQNSIPTSTITDSNFEGMGDALWNYENDKIYGGYGFRTSPQVYEQLEKITGQKITTFELKDARFYHLDTCLSILNGNTAAFVPEAFTPEGMDTLTKNFENLIVVPISEATEQLACNMCTPNGKDVVIQAGAQVTNQSLRKAGFEVHEVETSEYIKSGGSVFCMKMLLP